MDQESILSGEEAASRVPVRVKSAKLREAVTACLDQSLYPSEKLEAVVEAVESARRRDRVALGLVWPWQHRVVLAITNLRLLELAVRPMGRRLQGRIRSFPWYRVKSPSFKGDRLELNPRSDEHVAWVLRWKLDPKLLDRRQHPMPSEERFGTRVCDLCGKATFTSQGRCTGCHARPVDRRAVSRLAWCCPGAGLVAARRPLLAAARVLAELVAWAAYVLGVLWADSVPVLVGVLLAGAVVLPWVKLESARMARRAATRLGCGTDRSWHRSRRLRWIGVAVSLVALAVPLIWSGEIGTRVNADLGFVATQGEWQGNTAEPELRSRWTHRDGWEVKLEARPWKPFTDQDDVLGELAAQAAGDAESFTIGPHHGLRTRVTSSALDGEDSEVTILLHVLDAVGRDLHTMSTTAPSVLADERETAMKELLQLGIWSPARSSLI